MTINYTWKLTSFKKIDKSNTLNDVIFQTYWEKTGTDEHGNTGIFVGATPFDPKLIDPNNFTPYTSLKEETVLTWVKSNISPIFESHINQQIANQISEKANLHVEVHQSSFPWSTGTVYVPPKTPTV